MEMHKKCSNCGVNFETSHRRKKYCSKECRLDFLAKRRQKYYHLKKEVGTCVYCKSEFKFQPGDSPKRKYCSKRCRELDWKRNNLDRYKELGRQAWDRKKRNQPLLCRECNKPIPEEERKGGRFYCKLCSHIVNKRNSKRYQTRISEEFDQQKRNQGCRICGYNRFGCCLDYHHKNPQEKERRITMKMWKSNKEKIQNEIEKCILVCKNCHYELHYWLRNDEEKYLEIINNV